MESNPDKKHVWDKVNNWEEELLFLKAIIDKTELAETIKWGGPIYVYNKKNVIGIGGFKNYFAIWFINGVFLKDEKKRLINAQEDKTKSMRQWRFTSKDEVNEKVISLMQSAFKRLHSFSVEQKLPYRLAASVLGIKTIADSHRMRGLHP